MGDDAGFVRRGARRVMNLVTLAFGFVTAIAVLAVVASIPVIQLVSLGYLLEAEGRVARTGRLRGALPGLRTLARLGGGALQLLLTFLPWVIVADFRHDARLIDPTSRATRNLSISFVALGAVAALHAAYVLARRRREIAERARELPRYFLLGLKGFVAALAWIALPTALLAVGPRAPPIALLGGFLLALFVIPLPLLQARLAAEGRLGAGFELREVWRRYRRAPLAALFALVLTLALAIPLYVLKIELIPRDARWLAAGIFLLTILPTKLIAGKAYARGGREGRAFIGFRGFAALTGFAVAVVYVLVLFGTRFIEWRGATGLFEQHAFLVPVAFY